ncbi:MAG: hypothetical protein SGPRY_006499, partial [Prymnesium sp.]
ELLSLHRFVRIDMDRIRGQLPETKTHLLSHHCALTLSGAMTQKEAGAIAEIAAEEALSRNLNMWIDSSLQ